MARTVHNCGKEGLFCRTTPLFRLSDFLVLAVETRSAVLPIVYQEEQFRHEAQSLWVLTPSMTAEAYLGKRIC